jgi:hypothetical protein
MAARAQQGLQSAKAAPARPHLDSRHLLCLLLPAGSFASPVFRTSPAKGRGALVVVAANGGKSLGCTKGGTRRCAEVLAAAGLNVVHTMPSAASTWLKRA